MYGKSENPDNPTVYQVSPLSSQSLSSLPSSKKSNRTIVSAKKIHAPLDNEIFIMQPQIATVCNNDDNDDAVNDNSNSHCNPSQTVRRTKKEKTARGDKCRKFNSSRLFCCCNCKKSKLAKNSSFFTRPGDNNNGFGNNNTGNRQNLVAESLETEFDYLDNSDEATLRLKDSYRSYEERQKYKSIIHDAPLYQIYTEKASISESKCDARRLLAIVQPGSTHNPSNNLKFDDELFTAIDGDESDLNNQSSQKLPSNIAESPKSSIHLGSNERRDSPFHSPTSGTSLIGYRNSDSFKTSSYKRSQSNSIASERSSSRRSTSKPRRQTHEVQNFVNEVAGKGPNRVQWSEMPQVISADLARDLPEYQKKLQEALFEVITSEASYYRTLHILMEKFYKAPCMQPDSKAPLITTIEKRHLFSNISEIFFTSETSKSSCILMVFDFALQRRLTSKSGLM
ncbi:hypothetical protein MN116_003925 [Schistosoma mekongi]|uniref:DH domain-containing protein n=1 Tax=Schistosoma mekongi TaxID=38744 RepID=A0AAE1ZEP2_SCHME|nr:hypothetical protein MN116_003925 [Schistosoma mekongi]